MYSLLNRYKNLIIESFNYKDDIEPYLQIMMSYKNKMIDNTFISIYKKYYKLNAARLSNTFLDQYFDILKYDINKDVYEIAEKLEQIGCNSANDRKVHFSFFSKLKHTIDNENPIYDNFIASFYFFPVINTNWSVGKKIESYKENYEFLKYEYSRIIRNDLLKETINLFNTKIENSAQIGSTKKIDFLIWKFVSLLKSGKIRDKEILFG
jgi:hypothetical protein